MDANKIISDYLIPRVKSEEISEKFVDIEKILKDRNPRLARMLPAFVVRLMEKIVHQNDINNTIYNNRDYYGIDFIKRCFVDFGINLSFEGLENVDKQSRYIIASNHPLGGLDGMALMLAISEVRKDIVFPVNDLLLHVPQLQPLFIPVNKHGSNARNREVFNAAFESDYMILYFPAGLVSRRKKGMISDPEWKKTFISKAAAYQRDVLPVHINGRNSGFFYSFANWRVRLGIKTNIEMVLLPNELFRPRQKDIHIRFGKPVSYKTFSRKQRPNAWAALMQEHVLRLGSGIDDFDGLLK